MTGGQIVELACLVVTLIAVCLLAEAWSNVVDERIEKIRAQTRSDVYLRRAEAAERIIRDTAASPEFARHVDQALEQAEPTPDIRRIK